MKNSEELWKTVKKSEKQRNDVSALRAEERLVFYVES